MGSLVIGEVLAAVLAAKAQRAARAAAFQMAEIAKAEVTYEELAKWMKRTLV